MSDLDGMIQQSITPCITLGIQAGSSLIVVLRDFLDYCYLKASQVNGEVKYGEFLKDNKGSYFKDELEFANVTFDLHNSNLYREPVSKEERAMLQKMCKKLGIDYCLAKRPGNLEDLVSKKYVQHQPLSPEEEKIVNAFLYLDASGKPVFETESKDGHRIPKIRDDAYLLTIAEKDLPKWDLICTNLETTGKRSLGDLTRSLKVKQVIENQEKAAEKTSPAKDTGIGKQEKKQEKNPTSERILSFRIPKSKAVVEQEKVNSEVTIKVKVTSQDYIYIPLRFVRYLDDEKHSEIIVSIPENYEITVVAGKAKPVQRQIKDLSHMIPVQRTTVEKSR